MQTKKEDLRQTILMAAQKEFLVHGYEGGSMRVIAKKANTTLGNLYHYFKNKEAILEELLREPLEGLEMIVELHIKKQTEVYSIKELKDALRDMDNSMDVSELQFLMDERLIILFDLKTTRFVEVRNRILKQFKQHLAWHLRLKDDDSAYVEIITDMFISCCRHVLLEHRDVEKAKKEFIKVFKMLCLGLMVNREEQL